MNASPPLRNELIEPDARLVAAYGFVPNLFRAQGELPRAIEAEERLIDAVVVREDRLSRQQKQSVLRGVASVWDNDYCLALYGNAPSVVFAQDSALLKFAVKLAKRAPWVSGNDMAALGESGLDDVAILEAIATTAIGQMLCTLADGLRPELDRGLTPSPGSQTPKLEESFDWIETPKPYLESVPRLADDYPAYVFLREQFGFVPNLFRVQALRPRKPSQHESTNGGNL